MDLSLATLRSVRTVAEAGSFSAAAARLGFTQSAISRQVAAAERELGFGLFERLPRGVRLTGKGVTFLRQVAVALDALDEAERMLAEAPAPRHRIRFGYFAAAGLALVPRTLQLIEREQPELEVLTREATTPALIRGLRSGTLDFALLSARPPFRAPDQEKPPLRQKTVLELNLSLAVSRRGRLGGAGLVQLADLAGEGWVAAPGGDDPQLGVWPGLPDRPRVRHTARDWATKLQLVADGFGVTTAPAELFPQAPADVEFIGIAGVPEESRRLSLAQRPGLAPGLAAAMTDAVTKVVAGLVAQSRAPAPS